MLREEHELITEILMFVFHTKSYTHIGLPKTGEKRKSGKYLFWNHGKFGNF